MGVQTRRKSGTGKIKRTQRDRYGFEAYGPKGPGNRHGTYIGKFTLRSQAEKALDEWLQSRKGAP